MDQLSLFPEEGQSPGLPPELLEYRAGLFSATESDNYLQEFIRSAPWEQRLTSMYGKEIVTPRLTAWYGDPGTERNYASVSFKPLPWTPSLQDIRKRVEDVVGISFNSVLLNYYRDGNDSVAWHSDKEIVMGTHPVIASVSFGQVRRFDIRHKQDHRKKYAVRLESGSLLIMKGDLQQHWEHRIAKSAQPLKARVNLTFRVIV